MAANSFRLDSDWTCGLMLTFNYFEAGFFRMSDLAGAVPACKRFSSSLTKAIQSPP